MPIIARDASSTVRNIDMKIQIDRKLLIEIFNLIIIVSEENLYEKYKDTQMVNQLKLFFTNP